MEIVFHLGVHCTDDERLLRCLLKNRQLLADKGVAVPGPARYRNLVRDTVIRLKGASASAETQAMLLEHILDSDATDRLILSWDGFLSLPAWVLKDGQFYPAAAERVRALQNLFPDHECEFHLAIRNPAGFLPALHAQLPGKRVEAFLGGTDIHALYWSEMIDRIRAMNPDVPLTVWCDEDTPLIWPEVLKGVAGVGPETALDGENDLLTTLMEPEGLRRLEAYLASHPPASALLRRRVVSVFLSKFTQAGVNDDDAALPGWTQETLDQLTRRYDEDVTRIAMRNDLRFLTS